MGEKKKFLIQIIINVRNSQVPQKPSKVREE